MDQPSSIRDLVERHERHKIVIDAQRGICTLNFGRPYEIDLHSISSERDLLWCVRSLAELEWITGERMCYVIDAIAEHKRFERRSAGGPRRPRKGGGLESPFP